MSDQPKELEEVKKRLAEIEKKIDRLLELQGKRPEEASFVPSALVSLPEHLRKTALEIATMGEATAEQVSVKTGRARAAESDYLNQLADRGFLKKKRKGRQVFFQVFALYTQCPECGGRVLMTLDHCTACGAYLLEPGT